MRFGFSVVGFADLSPHICFLILVLEYLYKGRDYKLVTSNSLIHVITQITMILHDHQI